jgi:hypothetical protein
MLTPEGREVFVESGGVLADREDEDQQFNPHYSHWCWSDHPQKSPG